MTKAQKSQVVENLTESFKNSNAIAICDYKGLKVVDLENLRQEANKVNSSVQVVKNTLASIALKNAEKEGLELVGTNVIIWSEDQIGLAKTVANFAKTNKEKFVIKAGHFDGGAVEAAHIEALSKMPSRDELIGMLLSVWTAPIRNFVTGLDNLAKKDESAA